MAESAEDRRNQKEIADIIIRMFPDAFDAYEFFPPKSRLDGYFLRDGRKRIFFEIKHRYTFYRHFPDYFISASKLIAAYNMKTGTGLRTVALVRFADNVLVSFDLLETPHGFRTDGKRDAQERVAVYQWDDMKVLSNPRHVEPIRITEAAE